MSQRIKTYHQNGRLKEEYTLVNGVMQGACRSDFLGVIIRYQTYWNGVPNGLSTHFFENGSKSCEYRMINGKANGKDMSWYPDGTKESEATYVYNSLEGEAVYWYSNGNNRRYETWKNNKLNGIRTDWYENGNMKSQELYTDGVLDGECVYWYENGNMRRCETLKNNKLNGIRTEWYENGNMKSQGFYTDGVLTLTKGCYISYYENGNICNETTSDKFSLYYENGKKSSDTVYDKVYKAWDEDGKLITQKSLKHGIPHGLCIDYNSNNVYMYEDGKAVSIKDLAAKECKKYKEELYMRIYSPEHLRKMADTYSMDFMDYLDCLV